MWGRRPAAAQGTGKGSCRGSPLPRVLLAKGFWPRHAACDFMLSFFGRHEPVTISHFFDPYAAAVRGPRSSIMIGLVRAITVCATLVLGLISAQAADNAFKLDDLADPPIHLDAQLNRYA